MTHSFFGASNQGIALAHLLRWVGVTLGEWVEMDPLERAFWTGSWERCLEDVSKAKKGS